MEENQRISMTEIEELKRKEKKCLGVVVTGIVTTILGFAVVIGGAIKETYDLSRVKKPEIIQTYANAHATLSRLESEKANLSNELEVPYATPKIRQTLDRLYEDERTRIDSLNEAIVDVQENMNHMKKNSDFVNYRRRIDEISQENEFISDIGLGGGLLGILGVFGPGIIGLKYTEKRIKLENTQKQSGQKQ